MASLDNDRLQQLYEQADFVKDKEVKNIGKAVKQVVEDVAKFIGREDPLFKTCVNPSGSFYEDLKVEQPDEFDFMLCLEELSKPNICQTSDHIPQRTIKDPGYRAVKVVDSETSERWRSYISSDQSLNSKAMLERFEHLVSVALNKIPLPSKLRYVAFSAQMRKIPVTFKVTWTGTKYRDLEIFVDLVLCIKRMEWPEASEIDCPSDHPGYQHLKDVRLLGHHLVASTVGETGESCPCWRLSFSAAEGFVLRKILGNPELVHRAAIMTLKVLRKQHESKLHFLDKDDPLDVSFVTTWVFHSYVIKTTFLLEWLEHPEERYWRKDKLAKRVRAILKRMEESLQRKDICSFWVSDYKLFNFKARRSGLTGDCSNTLSAMVGSIKVS